MLNRMPTSQNPSHQPPRCPSSSTQPTTKSSTAQPASTTAPTAEDDKQEEETDHETSAAMDLFSLFYFRLRFLIGPPVFRIQRNSLKTKGRPTV